MMKTLRLKTLKWSALLLLACALGLNGPVLAKGLEFSENVILQKQPDTFSLVRHMTLRGTQREIGKKLTQIAIDRYGVQLHENPSDS